MRVLIVEDDELTSEALSTRLKSRLDSCEVVVAVSLADAEVAIGSRTFDAAVLDLRLPSSHAAADAAIEFGLFVESKLAAEQPGAVRIFLTASQAEVVLAAVQQGETADHLFCGDVFSMVDYVRKEGVDALDACVDLVCAHQDRLDSLDATVLEGDDGFGLDDRRALALTVRVAGGCTGRVLKTDGLSACATALVECFDESGASVGNAFCKSGPAMEIDRERRGYQLAEFQLPSTSRPALARTLAVGPGRSRALIFTQAPTASRFFDKALVDADACAEVVAQLPEVMSMWSAAASRGTHSVQALVDEVISDSVRTTHGSALAALSLGDFGDLTVELITHCQHGDLHGSNLYITNLGQPFLIDFAHTRVQPGPVDPVSLELSLIFHPDSPAQQLLLDVDATAWFDLDYVQDLPAGPIISACRQWVASAGHDARSHAVTTLLYALWILNHAQHPEIALGLARGALERLTQ